MSTSGTTAFDLDFVELAEEAFEQAGVQISTAHDLQSARRSLNLVLLDWANRGLNLWTVVEAGYSLVAGTAALSLSTATVDVMEMVVRTGSGVNQYDYPLERVSFSGYANIPDKERRDKPTQFFVRRNRSTPTVVVYPVPDITYSAVCWEIRQLQDVGSGGTYTQDVPRRFLPALVAGLACEVAKKRPESQVRVPLLKQYYEEVFARAADEDRDRSSWRILPYIP